MSAGKLDQQYRPKHFEYLAKEILPKLIRENGYGVQTKLTVWFAGCATGEEAYTLAMFLEEFAETCRLPGYRYVILGTDDSIQLLSVAREATYSREKIEDFPMPLRLRYLNRCISRGKIQVRVISELRERVHFRKLDLVAEDYKFRENMDLVFFSQALDDLGKRICKKVLVRASKVLSPGGYLFTMDNNRLSSNRLQLVQVKEGVFRKSGLGQPKIESQRDRRNQFYG